MRYLAGVLFLLAGVGCAGGGTGMPLAATTVDGVTISGIQYEPLTPGDRSSQFDFMTEGAKVQALRAWVGDREATGAPIAIGKGTSEGFTAYVEVPQTLPTRPKVWVEVNTVDGQHIVAFLEPAA